MYSAIYRDFRPDRFDQIIGQDHIVKILKNQIASRQTGHAYLFCGTRGTGKTTTARILAKALNCESEGERPCGVCDSCISIKEGTFLDVIEIDAASNNGVDSIRELRESVKYPPVKGRNKVYIIDEVHMLSQGAFNALLKTLEEPPQNVVFILATTEPQKLPATILSRCMRLDFRRVSEESIIDNMKMICRARGIEADPGALSLIAVNADGSVRDSLSILEQCISTGADSICRDDVAELLGTAGEESLIGLTGCIIRGQISEALLLLDRIIRSGSDVKQFMKEWLTHFRSLLMAKYVAQPENILSMSVENVLRVKEQSAEITTELLNRGITDLTKTIAEARWSSQPRVLLEMCIVRLGAPQESEETFAFRNDAVRTSLQQSAAAEKTDTAQIRSDSAASDRVSEEERKSPVSAGQRERPAPPVLESSSEVGLEESEAAPDIVSSDDEIMIFGSDDIEDEFGAMMPTIQQIYDAEPVSPAAGRGTAGESRAQRTPFREEELPVKSAEAPTEIPESGEQTACGPEVDELWNTAVKKAVGEKPMLIRIETKAHPIRIQGGILYVSAEDDYTEKMLMEKGKELLESKLEMYYGSPLALCLDSGGNGAPVSAGVQREDSSGAEEIARQIEERFHMKVEIE